jgi:hypothetical protein
MVGENIYDGFPCEFEVPTIWSGYFGCAYPGVFVVRVISNASTSRNNPGCNITVH